MANLNGRVEYPNQNQKEKCAHSYAPLGFQKVSSDETKIEVVAAVFCTRCSMFRTKILYFDRQKVQKDGQI